MTRRIAISSGHGLKIRGAEGYLDEVDEARRVVDRVAGLCRENGVECAKYHDDVSTTQNENLERIVNWHNDQIRDLDVSVHFNAHQDTSKPMGTEVWYYSEDVLAAEMSDAIANAGGFLDRGVKWTADLYFLNNTARPALLLEICFVDSSSDAAHYRDNFNNICLSIAETLAEKSFNGDIDRPVTMQIAITATVFGGESDPNYSAYDETKFLNDEDLYVALPYRFEGERPKVRVYNRKNNVSAIAEIWDTGPWMISDDYWTIGMRPIAETCYNKQKPLPDGPNAGDVPSNPAGIDLSPALADVLEHSGLDPVDWEFV